MDFLTKGSYYAAVQLISVQGIDDFDRRHGSVRWSSPCELWQLRRSGLDISDSQQESCLCVEVFVSVCFRVVAVIPLDCM